MQGSPTQLWARSTVSHTQNLVGYVKLNGEKRHKCETWSWRERARQSLLVETEQKRMTKLLVPKPFKSSMFKNHGRSKTAKNMARSVRKRLQQNGTFCAVFVQSEVLVLCNAESAKAVNTKFILHELLVNGWVLKNVHIPTRTQKHHYNIGQFCRQGVIFVRSNKLHHGCLHVWHVVTGMVFLYGYSSTTQSVPKSL